MSQVKNRVRELREARGFTAIGFSQMLGWSQDKLREVEANERVLDLIDVIKLERAFNFTMDASVRIKVSDLWEVAG
jgi:transcriptional regulator with XRE-family HTH domain